MPADLPREARIRSSRRFKAILDQKASAADRLLTVFAASYDGPRPRLGLVVGKRHGSAPLRNRKKRLLREAFRAVQSDLPPGFDFILIPRTGPAAELDAYVRSLGQLASRAAARAPSSGR